MDNLWFHKTGGMKDLFEDLDIFPLYNIPNCPETAPIEACFSIVKCHYKRMRLQCLVNDELFDAEQHIRAAFDQVKSKHVANCVVHSLKILH